MTTIRRAAVANVDILAALTGAGCLLAAVIVIIGWPWALGLFGILLIVLALVVL